MGRQANGIWETYVEECHDVGASNFSENFD